MGNPGDRSAALRRSGDRRRWSEVWGDLQLNEALSGTPYEFDPLADGLHFTIAIRRAIRSGRSDGIPVEDLGIRGIPTR